MIKQSAKNSLNVSFIRSVKHPNKKTQQIFSHPELQYGKGKKRSQSFMLDRSGYEKLAKQVESHKKNKSSFNTSFSNNNMDKQLSNYKKKQSNRKSSSKHKKQRINSSVVSHQTQKVRGGIRKNKVDQNVSYQQNNNHHVSFDSNVTRGINRKKQNKSIALRNQQQNQGQRKQDNIKTDFQQRTINIDSKKEKTIHQQDHLNNQTIQENIFCKQNINPNIINVAEFNKLDEMTSKRISKLQSRSNTIDLLKFTINTKLSKDVLNQSSNCFNSLLSSDNKSSHRQYMEEILKLKEIEANFYIQKITTLQNQLNKTKKQKKTVKQETQIQCHQNNRKTLIQKNRYEQQNQLLKRQNQALRTIILKKINHKITF